ncbi:DUF2339 domain-containing protein [Pelagibacterium halotolerans]|uniref:Putative integral membrane protein n=1 Tax=Pelagibacterium halotolerans (strain DSM 22347 / JCM 15775 / CGMCC 1.7692 / B2) TaxID=1082931 RepID=G4RF12_PELHB|nr:DUF2339 domain-containing protein [Pelagibacterium halotolerans]AEQ52945.1 putative integral membrane protein [Pelagibacterium halotolerans B2]QJR17389.1 DUF2339 domain-containing protein [Pelagibacterium halotolerans]SEA73083.1 Uncharacterized membrane protein [Pelagibacterium halotolerans]
MADYLLIIILILAFMAFQAHLDIRALKRRVGVLEAGASARADDSAEREAASAAPTAEPAAEPEPASNVAQGPWMAAQARVAAGVGEERETGGGPGTEKRGFNWEHMLGVRLPVWGGAALLLFAAFLFASYAMEQGVFTPAVRVWACGAGAAIFLAAAFFARWRKIANWGRISGALAAVAIGLGYATCYLATAVFAFWPPLWGAAGSGLVGLVAIAIALVFGRLVLVLGLLGGYLAPVLLGELADGWTLLAYLTTVLVASHAVAGWRGWWTSALFSSGLALLWGAVWGFFIHNPRWDSGLDLTLWLLAIAMAPVAAELVARADERIAIMRRDGPVAAAGGSALMLILLGVEALPGAAFWPGFVAWMAFLAIASVLRPRRMDLAGVAMGGFVVALVLWRDPEPGVRLGVLIPALPIVLGAAVIHIAAGRAQRIWASAGVAILMVSVLSSLVDFDGWAGARDVPQIWAILCVGLAVAIVAILVALRGTSTSRQIAPPLAAGASGLASVAIGLVVEPGYYALSAALQVAGLGLVFWRYRVRTLLYLAMVYVAGYLGLIALGHGVATEFAGDITSWPYGRFIPVLALDDAPWQTLIVPGVALVTGATLFALAVRDRLVAVIDFAGLLVLALGVHLAIAPLAGADPVRTVFVFGPLWFPLHLGTAAAALWVASRFGRQGLYWGGSIIAVLAGLALVRLVVVPVTDFWPRMEIAGIAIFNLATVTLVLASGLLVVIGRLIKPTGGEAGRWAGIGFQALGGVTAFVWMLVTIRHGFHPDLLQGETLRVERYGYTGGMLAFAFGLLWLGTARDAQAIRIASLAVALATVGKLFVFDMGGLEGLWRIGSFLGLGLALLGVSWFYARFVFGVGGRHGQEGGAAGEASASPA